MLLSEHREEEINTYESYCFKKYYGMSPNKYREEHLGKNDV